jgi:hypothetical protein
MKKQPILRTPPVGAPEGTVWFGGPVDRFKVTLRIRGEDLVPNDVSALLRCEPSVSEQKGVPVVSCSGITRVPKTGRWSLRLDSRECSPTVDVDEGIQKLLALLPSERDVWASLTSRYQVDLFCGLFLEAENRGFGLSPEVTKLLSDRGIEVGFDIYFDV